MSKRIYVGNLSFSTTEDGLSSVFSQYGFVISVQIIRDKFTDQSRGFGFVEMESEEDAITAIVELNGQMVDGRRIRVNAAEEKGQGRDHGRREGFQREGRFGEGRGFDSGHQGGTSYGRRNSSERQDSRNHHSSGRSNRSSNFSKGGSPWDYSY